MVLAFVATAIALNTIIPPYENLDELEHAEVIRHIAVTGRLPVHDEAEAAGFHVRQEASQPPLYHILAAGTSRLLGLSATPHAPEPVPTNLVACGLTGTPYNKMTWVHDPYAVASERSSSDTTIRVLRLFSTTLQVATVVGVWTLVRRVFPSGPLPALATALVAFNPQLLLLAAGVNNDNAVIPLATWGLVVAFDIWNRALSWPRSLLFGILGGLAALSKLSGAALLAIGGIALLTRIAQRRTRLAAAIPHGVVMVATALALVSPWALRNIALYGDATALAPMLAKVGTRSTPIAIGEARLMTLSFWGQLPCGFYPRALYWPYLALTIGGLVGVAVVWKRLATHRRVWVLLCAAWFVVIILAWIRWDTMTAATGGRLLFPAIGGLAAVLAVGWQAWGRRVARLWAVFLPLWAMVVLVAGPTMMARPPKVSTPSEPAASLPEAIFGDAVALERQETGVTRAPGRCFFASGAYCGSVLNLSADWRALRPLEENLTLVVQLVSAAPGATDLRLNYNYWPGRGNLPTSTWPTGLVIVDTYALPLPPSDMETQAWKVTLAYLNPTDGSRLPVTAHGEAVGDSLTLGLVRVPGRQPEATDLEALAPPVTFSTNGTADALHLVGAQALAQGNGTWTVDLLWECTNTVDVDVVTFVHAYDAASQLLTAGDGPPRGGTFPTSLWEPGDRIRSQHVLTLAPPTPPHTIAVGLYLPDTGVRLRATRDGAPLPDDAHVIWRQAP